MSSLDVNVVSEDINVSSIKTANDVNVTLDDLSQHHQVERIVSRLE